MCREAGHQPVAIVTSRVTSDPSRLGDVLDGTPPDVDVLLSGEQEEPPAGARTRVEAGDGPSWILESEPA